MINISYEGNAKSKSESTNRMSIIKKTDRNNCEGGGQSRTPRHYVVGTK